MKLDSDEGKKIAKAFTLSLEDYTHTAPEGNCKVLSANKGAWRLARSLSTKGAPGKAFKELLEKRITDAGLDPKKLILNPESAARGKTMWGHRRPPLIDDDGNNLNGDRVFFYIKEK